MPGFREALSIKRKKRQYKIRKKTNRTPKKRKIRRKSSSKGKITALEKMVEQNKKKKKENDWTQSFELSSMLDMGMNSHTKHKSISKPEIPSGPPWKYAIPVLSEPPNPKDIKVKPLDWKHSSPKDISVKLNSQIYEELTEKDYKEISDKTIEEYLGEGIKKKRKNKSKKKKKSKNKSKKST